MDLKQIQELIKMVSKSGISELKVKENEVEITIKNVVTSPAVQVQHIPTMIPAPMMQSMPVTHAEASAPSANTESIARPAEATEPAAENTFIFRSPMIGTFYRKPGPDKPFFVNVGDAIKQGDVLCIIEAMKLFNEIEFDGEGSKIVKILVDESSPVEYDQPLFVIEKI